MLPIDKFYKFNFFFTDLIFLLINFSLLLATGGWDGGGVVLKNIPLLLMNCFIIIYCSVYFENRGYILLISIFNIVPE